MSPSPDGPGPEPIPEETEETYQFKKEKKSLGFGVPKRAASKLSAAAQLFVPGQDAMFGQLRKVEKVKVKKKDTSKADKLVRMVAGKVVVNYETGLVKKKKAVEAESDTFLSKESTTIEKLRNASKGVKIPGVGD